MVYIIRTTSYAVAPKITYEGQILYDIVNGSKNKLYCHKVLI